jgi:phospholipid/cholesterol/gamma-HCH transport system substrate-binding protein
MPPNRKNLMVGLVVLTAMIGLGWMILRIANTSTTLFTRGPRFSLVADRADGVAEGSPVLYLGVNVGRVLGVKRNPDNSSVSIDAILNTGEQIPLNVVGNIKAQSALGSSAEINLEPVGAPGKESIRTGQEVRAHFAGSGLVPPEVVALATQVREQQLIKHFDESVVSMRLQLEKAGKLLDSAGAIVSDPAMRDNVQGTIANVRLTSANLERFSGHLDQLSDQTTATIKEVHDAVADGDQKLDVLSQQLTQRMQQLAEVLDKVDGIAGKVDKGSGTAARLVNDPRLYENLVDSSRDLDVTFKDMQRLVEQWEQDGFSLKLK